MTGFESSFSYLISFVHIIVSCVGSLSWTWLPVGYNGTITRLIIDLADRGWKWELKVDGVTAEYYHVGIA